METRAARTFFLAIAAALLLAGRAAAAEPVILAVDGLDFGKFGCEAGVMDGALANLLINPAKNIHATACLAIKAGTGLMETGEGRRGYLRERLKDLCGGNCGRFAEFDWDRDIKNSRAAAEDLKQAIMRYGLEAKNEGRPFIIVAHSWGGVLAGEALAELGDSLPFRVNKVVTLGTPLGGDMYRAAVHGLISSQNFYMEPQPAPSVDSWINYWAGRDYISSPLSIKGMNIVNLRLDSGESFDMTGALLLRNSTNPNATQEQLAATGEDLKKMVLPRCTFVWHDLYFSDSDIELPSIGEKVMTGWMTRGITEQISSAD